MSIKIEMTLQQLRQLLDNQKVIVIERLRGSSSRYNNKSTEGQQYSLDINEEKFKREGMEARYPDDYNVLNKYLK